MNAHTTPSTGGAVSLVEKIEERDRRQKTKTVKTTVLQRERTPKPVTVQKSKLQVKDKPRYIMSTLLSGFLGLLAGALLLAVAIWLLYDVFARPELVSYFAFFLLIGCTLIGGVLGFRGAAKRHRRLIEAAHHEEPASAPTPVYTTPSYPGPAPAPAH